MAKQVAENQVLSKAVILRGCDFFIRAKMVGVERKGVRRGNCSVPATTLSYLSSRPQGRDLQFTSPATNLSWKRHPPPFILRACASFDLPVFFAHPIKCFQTLYKTAILRVCDFFDRFVLFAHPTRRFQTLHKTVILLPRHAVGAKRLANLSHKEGL